MGDQKTTNVIVLVAGLLLAVMAALTRIVRLEDAVRTSSAAQLASSEAFGKRIDTLSLQVGKQNGRVGKLEEWQQRILGMIALVLFVAPFVFWGLSHISN